MASPDINIRVGELKSCAEPNSLLFKIRDPFEESDLGTVVKDSMSATVILKSLKESFCALYDTAQLTKVLT
jgi:hypothetical protein